MSADHGSHWRPQRHRRGARETLTMLLLLAASSCVPPVNTVEIARVAAPPVALPEPPPAPIADTIVASAQAPAANAAIPVALGPNPAARPFVMAGSFAERMRALDCLADAVYYEARSESEDGQRAVAQVVLNRVRHPSYPASVCGVVYQGPLKAGGGCQFSFTCDGSLARAPAGAAWHRARRIAAAALGGSVFARVGLSAHYHADFVLPHWAPRLEKAAVIGTHIFYRWPGTWGTPAAFSQRYAGRESARMPTIRLASTPAAMAAAAPAAFAPSPKLVTAPIEEPMPVLALVEDRLPQSRVREEYRNAGAWRGTD